MRIQPTRATGVPILDVAHKPLAGWKIVVKTLEDRILALLLLILVAPIMVLIALVIKLDSKGPVLFRQQRYGFNNKVLGTLRYQECPDTV